MSRTRRHLDDDPRKPRKFRQKSGVNLIHEEPWYGFNVAYKMPVRDDEDPSGNPFLGFSRLIIAFQELTNAELDTDSVDGRTIKALEIAAEHQQDNSTTHRVLAPDAVLNGNIGEQISATHLPNLVGHDGDLPFDRITGGVPGSRITGNIDVSNLPANIPANNVPNLQGLNGDLPFSRITGDLGLGRTSGKLGAHRISGKIPKHNISGVNWDQVDNKPPLATKHYVDTTDGDTRAWVRRNFQAKP